MIARGCLELNAYGIQMLTDQSITVVSKGHPQLEELNVSDAHRCCCTNDSITLIAEHCPYLAKLLLLKPHGWDVEGDRYRQSPKRMEINVFSCSNLKDESIMAIANFCPELKRINVPHCLIKDESKKAIV